MKPKINQGGFTLVELIVAILVGAILIFSTNMIIVNHAYLSQQGRDTTLANAYAEGKIESLRSIGYTGLSNGTTDITNELPAELNGPRSGSLVITTQSIAIKKAVIAISYNEQGKTRSVNYTTYIGELGVGQY